MNQSRLGLVLGLTFLIAFAGVGQQQNTTPSAEEQKAIDLNKEGESFYGTGDSVKAKERFSAGLKICEKLEKPITATILNNLAYMSMRTGDYEAAEPLYVRSMEIRKTLNIEKSVASAQTLNSLGELYTIFGKYADAKKRLEQSLKIRKELGNTAGEAATLNNLGYLYSNMGQHAKAEPFYLDSLELRKKLGDAPGIAESENNLADLYEHMGKYDEAEKLNLSSLARRQANLGPKHILTAQSLNNLANLYEHMEKFADAEKLFLASLEIYQAKFPDHPWRAAALNNLAFLYANRKKYREAETRYLESLKIYETKLGTDHPDVARPLLNLAFMYAQEGRHAEAEPLYLRSLEIRTKKLGAKHPSTGIPLTNLALNYASRGEWAKAVQGVNTAAKMTAEYLPSILPTLSESEQLNFLKAKIEESQFKMLSLGVAAPKHAGLASAEWLLNGKALAYQALAEQMILARQAKTPEAKKLFDQLTESRTRLAAHVNRVPLPGKEAEYQQDLQQFNAVEKGRAEKLARAVGRPYRDQAWVSLESLRAKLGPNTAFVDIARFDLFDFGKNESQGLHYVAWIVPPKGDVQVIDLGKAELIDQLVEKTRQSLIHSAKSITVVGDIKAWEVLQKPLQELSAKTLHKLLPALKQYDEWIVSPDGALWLTPWNALLLEKGDFAVEKYLIRHVVSGRDLVLELPKEVKSKSVYIFADPDYDLNPGEVMKLASLKPQRENEELRSVGSIFRTLKQVPRLEGTALEAEAARKKLKEWLGLEPQVFLEGQASEAMLKGVKNPRILILATHGYFLPSQEVVKKGQPIEHPWLRCGLLLAGCNQRKKAKTGEDDGILTGLEIIGLDLHGCELVVLSACETGLGDVRSGEGVAGLRQAFQLAGANGVVASLWKVPDLQTAYLMNTFFGELAKGRSQAQALREAQLQRIASRRKSYGAAHPFFWAAFTLTNRGYE